MARRRGISDEQRSYGTVFLLGVGLLLIGTVWTVWDENISRRPWKRYQAEFFQLEIDRAREALAAEDARLDKDPAYQDIAKELAAARASVDGGDNARRLSELQTQKQAAQIHLDEREFHLRLVKSRLEEAWYDYDHARLTGEPTEPRLAHIDTLNAEREGIDKSLDQAQEELRRIQSEMDEIRSVVQTLEKKQRDLEGQRDQLAQKLDGLVLKVGPWEFPKIPKIRQVVLNEFERNPYDQPIARVDRCESCHAGINKVDFENDPNPYKTHPHRDILLGKHPSEQFGCTPCHNGQGAAVNSIAQGHGQVKFWEHPLYQGHMIQASCIECHTDVRLPGAEVVAQGEYLFENLGCHGCHLVQGYGELPKVGPYLRRIGAKVDPAWLVDWVENPHQYRPHTKMPNFLFKRDQAIAIAAYLLSTTAKESEAWLATHPSTNGNINPRNEAQVAHGLELVNSIGCRGCHGFADGESPATLGANKDIAPNLNNVAQKTNATWMYHWLKDPRGYSPVSRMPSLRLSDEEAAAITSYLLTLGTPAVTDAALVEQLKQPEMIHRGEDLVRKYGCSGCHDIPGMEAESRIGVELTTFGSKPLEELFFGYETKIPFTWQDWTVHKLESPRIYQTERIEQLMPQFDLAQSDVDALVVFLKSRRDAKVPEHYRPRATEREQALVAGRRLVAQYNCVGCHVIENRGGAILARYEETPTLAPPVLNGEGAKVQPAWLFDFIKHPTPLRPWLKVRMPTFSLSDAEATAIDEFFLAQQSIPSPFVYVKADYPTDLVDAGKLLASPDYLNCFSCHQQGDKKPEGPQEGWAPDLALAKERLNPEWIIRWLRDPQKVQPGTKMPSFYNVTDDVPDGPEDILGGNEEKQIEALRDYIMSLPGSGSAQMAAAHGAPAAQDGGAQAN